MAAKGVGSLSNILVLSVTQMGSLFKRGKLVYQYLQVGIAVGVITTFCEAFAVFDIYCSQV